MASSLNKTIIIGRLGMDPDLRQGKTTEVANFSLANSTFKDGHEEVQWHRICAFGKQAQKCSKQLHKGDLCCIEGRLDVHPYEKNGEKHLSHSIVVEDVTLLAPKRRQDSPKSTCQTASAEENFLF